MITVAVWEGGFLNDSILLGTIKDCACCDFTDAIIGGRKLINYQAFATCWPCFSHKIDMTFMEFDEKDEINFRNEVSEILFCSKNLKISPPEMQIK
jgi:hypothetical protein